MGTAEMMCNVERICARSSTVAKDTALWNEVCQNYTYLAYDIHE